MYESNITLIELRLPVNLKYKYNPADEIVGLMIKAPNSSYGPTLKFQNCGLIQDGRHINKNQNILMI